MLIDVTVSGAVNSRVASRIVTETGGNPLAILELLALLSPHQLAGRASLPERLPVGRGIEAHFLRRVKTLPPDTRSLLLASAAPGDDPAALWRAAALLNLTPEVADPLVGQDILSLDPRVTFGTR